MARTKNANFHIYYCATCSSFRRGCQFKKHAKDGKEKHVATYKFSACIYCKQHGAWACSTFKEEHKNCDSSETMASPAVIRWLKRLTLPESYRCEEVSIAPSSVEFVDEETDEEDEGEEGLDEIAESSTSEEEQEEEGVQDRPAQEDTLPQLSEAEVQNLLTEIATPKASAASKEQLPPVVARPYVVGAPTTKHTTVRRSRSRGPSKSKADARAISQTDAQQNIIGKNMMLEKRVQDQEKQLLDYHRCKLELKALRQEVDQLLQDKRKDRATTRAAQEEVERMRIQLIREQELRKISDKKFTEAEKTLRNREQTCLMRGNSVQLHVPIRSDEICAPILSFDTTQLFRSCYENEEAGVRCHHLEVTVLDGQFRVERSSTQMISIHPKEEDVMPPMKRPRPS